MSSFNFRSELETLQRKWNRNLWDNSWKHYAWNISLQLLHVIWDPISCRSRKLQQRRHVAERNTKIQKKFGNWLTKSANMTAVWVPNRRQRAKRLFALTPTLWVKNVILYSKTRVMTTALCKEDVCIGYSSHSWDKTALLWSNKLLQEIHQS